MFGGLTTIDGSGDPDGSVVSAASSDDTTIWTCFAWGFLVIGDVIREGVGDEGREIASLGSG